MPTTPNGTAYTVRRTTLPTHGAVSVGVADVVYPRQNIPTVLYTHGAGGSATQFETLEAWSGVRNWMIDNGWAWVEGAGGGLQPWGNPASEAAYIAALGYADSVLDVGPVVVLGRSMGGAVAARLFTTSSIASRCVGLIVNSGVQDLIWAYDSGRWTNAFHTAWGVANRAELVAAVQGYNPIDGPASNWAGTSVQQLVGTADDVVPPGPNAYAIRTMYAGQPTVDLLDVREGGDHGTTNGSYLQVGAMTSFLASLVPSDSKNVFRVTARYLLLGGKRHLLTPR